VEIVVRIGLIDVDSKIPNLALMKLSAWHKAQGDEVKLYDPLFDRPDRVYASKVFSFTFDFAYWPEDVEIIKGGTGYDLSTTLPDEVEAMYPDYGLFECDYAMGFVTRGCIRRCQFCLVPNKEGSIRQVAEISDFWRGQKRLMLLDNNLTAMSDVFMGTCRFLSEHRIETDFSQGLDIRLIDDEKAQALSSVRLWKRIHFAWDNLRDEAAVRKGIETLTRYLHPDKLMFYVLVGYNTTFDEDMHRVQTLIGYGANPFVMVYRAQDGSVPSDRRLKHLARWANRPHLRKAVSWDKYLRSGVKGIVC
jgi:hypothetical protein